MKATEKISVSLAKDDLKWAKAQAKARGASLSAVVSEAIHRQRQSQARMKLLDALGGVEDVTQEELDAVRYEWK